MSISESQETRVETDAVEILTPEQRAAKMAVHWDNFVAGHEAMFAKYFVVNYNDHDVARRVFMELIGGSTEIPEESGMAVAAVLGRATLRAYPSYYEEGDLGTVGMPYEVWYKAERFEPVQ